MNEFELTILNGIQNIFGSVFLDFLMPFITLLAEDGIIPIALAIILIFCKKTRKTGINIALSLLLGFILGNVFLKNIVGRTRPYDLSPDFPLLIDKLSDYSFPSGHTLAAFETAVSIFLYNKKFGIAAIILACLVAFSRLYLFVHYPTDILASIILGSLFALVSFIIIKKIYNNSKMDKFKEMFF